MMVSLYFGHPSMKWFSIISYVIRILMVIIWGWYIMIHADLRMGHKIGDHKHMLGLFFVRFITVREIALLPVMVIKTVFTNRLKQYEYIPDPDMMLPEECNDDFGAAPIVVAAAA